MIIFRAVDTAISWELPIFIFNSGGGRGRCLFQRTTRNWECQKKRHTLDTSAKKWKALLRNMLKSKLTDTTLLNDCIAFMSLLTPHGIHGLAWLTRHVVFVSWHLSRVHHGNSTFSRTISHTFYLFLQNFLTSRVGGGGLSPQLSSKFVRWGRIFVLSSLEEVKILPSAKNFQNSPKYQFRT